MDHPRALHPLLALLALSLACGPLAAGRADPQPTSAVPQGVEARPEAPAPLEAVAVALPLPEGDAAGFDPAGATGLAYPLAQPALEQGPWGWRWSAARQRWRPHTGVDLITPAGTAVLAVRSGRVVLAQEVAGYGLTLVLEHPGGWRSLYAHLQSSAVALGQTVQRGEAIGQAGASGNASTPQIHFELHRAAAGSWQAIDPAPWLGAAPEPLAATP